MRIGDAFKKNAHDQNEQTVSKNDQSIMAFYRTNMRGAISYHIFYSVT